MSPGKLVDEKDVGCQDKSGPGTIHEVILVHDKNPLFPLKQERKPFLKKHSVNEKPKKSHFMGCQ